MGGENKKEEEQQVSVATHLRRGLTSTSSMAVSYVVSVHSASTTTASLEAQISGYVSSGQFSSMLKVLGTAYGISDLASASCSSISFISLVPTAKPTMAPSQSPTPNTGLAWLQNNYIAWSCVAGVVGLVIIYCIYRCVKRYNKKRELELQELDLNIQEANERLAKKYEPKIEKAPAPHISKMRENFRKQFGREVSSNSYTKTKSKDSGEDYSEYPEQEGNVSSAELPLPSFRNAGGSGSPGKGVAKGKKFFDFDDRDEEESKVDSFEKKITSITANELRAFVKELLSKNASLRVGGMPEREVNSKIYTLIEGKGKLPPKDIAILQRLATELNTENEKFEASMPPPPPAQKKKATKTSTATATATAAGGSGTKKSKETPASPTSPSTPIAGTKKFGFGVAPAANPLPLSGPSGARGSKGLSRSQSANAR